MRPLAVRQWSSVHGRRSAVLRQSAVALGVGGVLLSSVLCFTACTKRETPVEEGIRTKTLLVANGGEPTDLDPHITANGIDGNIQMALFEGLTAFDEKSGRPVPAAAERWETSPDGLT